MVTPSSGAGGGDVGVVSVLEDKQDLSGPRSCEML